MNLETESVIAPQFRVSRSANTGPSWRHRTVILAVCTAAAIRLILFVLFGDLQPYSSLRETYFSTAAALASGHGYVTETPFATAANNGFDQPTSSVQYMRQREKQGGRVDAEHPFPRTLHGWLPGTRHPHGYGTLVYLLYSVSNYTPTLWMLHIIQILADAVACILISLFARNLFDARVGRAAAWLYALCPPAIFLSFDLLPDAFHGFFMSLTLALISFVRFDQIRNAAYAGAALGIGCYFRTEYILLPAVLFVALWALHRRLFRALGESALMTGSMLVVLLPLALWMKSAIGEFRFTSTTGGGGLYESLGEDPNNPWGIVATDGWLHEDAVARGFNSAWGPEANRFYARKYREYVMTYPRRYFKMVLTQRLPLALATPYETGNRSTRSEFNFTKYRTEEGLTRWGVIRKYPLTVLKYMGPQLGMAAYSGLLTLCVIGVGVSRPSDWRRWLWMLLPWIYPIITISLLKMIEPRNLAPTLVPAIAASSVMLIRGIDWFKRARESHRPQAV